MTKVVESGVIWGSRSQYVTDGPKPVRGDRLPCKFAEIVLIYFLGGLSDRCKNESSVAYDGYRFVFDLFNYVCFFVSWDLVVVICIGSKLLNENKINNN